MSGSVRRDRLLVDRPRTPLGTSVVTCSTGQADTSFAHHFDLPRVSMWNVGRSFLTSLTRTDGLLQVLNCLLLAAETVALLVMQPAKLLKDLCMLRVSDKHTSISRLGIVVLKRSSE